VLELHPLLNCSSQTITCEIHKEQNLSHTVPTRESEPPEALPALFLYMKRAISMVNKCFSREYIFLPTSNPTIIMTGKGRLVRLANHLGSIVHPGEGLVTMASR
jgi:hypothetical protein